MSREPVQVLFRHMLGSAREAHDFVRDKSRGELDGERQLQHALIRCIEIIGEAASRIDPDFRQAHRDTGMCFCHPLRGLLRGGNS